MLAIGAAMLIAAAPSAHAGAGVVHTTVTAVTGNVTYSSPATAKTPALNTRIGYLVNVSSDPANTNTINNVTFTATSSVTDLNEAAEFSSAEGATCGAAANPAGSPANARTISCSLGQLRAGAAHPTFAIFFKAPVADPAGPPASDIVTLHGTTFYAEGTGGVQSPPQNSTVSWPAAGDPPLDVTLGTPNPTLVKSVLEKSGGTLFTGAGFGTPANPFATTVVVPPEATFTTATIQVGAAGDANCSNFTTCYLSTVTIPGTFDNPYLTIVLRQDASTIKGGTKIQSVVLIYLAADSTQTVIGLCASPTTPRTDGIPCIAKQTYYKNKTVPGWTTDLDGDFEWTLINKNNGGYKVL
jgi:hypothetical protein